MQCLEWMFINRLIVPSTFVRYDDWPNKNATHGAAKGTTFYGQKKAHALLTEKFRVKWKHVARARTDHCATCHCTYALCSPSLCFSCVVAPTQARCTK